MRIITLIILFLSSLAAYAQFEENFRPIVDGDPISLAQYMEQAKVRGFSFYASFGDGSDTSALRGHAGDAEQTALTLDTRFQAGSMGGAAVCLAILELVQEEKIDLDAPANNYLETPLVDKRSNPDGPVTVRDLLTYKRNFKVNQKPKGYPFGVALPTMEEILKGSGPCNTPAIEVKGNLNKSGNSQFTNTLLLQLILEKHYSKPFPMIMQEHIFEPLGMSQTFYALELTEEQKATTAVGHDDDGEPIPGGYYRYPEQGASGLWTTPRDYTKLVRHVMDAAEGKDNRLISSELAKAGLNRQFKFRSLIFHINDYGDIYWGGNGIGFYMYMQAWPEIGLITVGACNKNLQWRLVNPATWQTRDYWLSKQEKD
jgi:CubicO group peptidase (beta-lactamase class C family)